MTTTCKNCNSSLRGHFCSNCGQTANTHQIDLKSIIHEIQHSVLHIDKGILYTTKELFTRPGHTIREYLDGKRIKHFKPIAYALVLSTIYTLLSHKSSNVEQFMSGVTEAFSEGSKRNLNFVNEILQWMKNHYAYTSLIFIPITSLVSYLAFFKSKYNYFQHIILNSFVEGQKTVVLLLMLPILYFVDDKNSNYALDFFPIFFGMILTFWTYYQFFNSTKPFKRIFLTLVAYLLLVVSFFLVMVAILLSTGIN